MRHARDRALNLKITPVSEATLIALQLALTAKSARPFTKTDVVEMALLHLAKKEKVSCDANLK